MYFHLYNIYQYFLLLGILSVLRAQEWQTIDYGTESWLSWDSWVGDRLIPTKALKRWDTFIQCAGYINQAFKQLFYVSYNIHMSLLLLRQSFFLSICCCCIFLSSPCPVGPRGRLVRLALVGRAGAVLQSTTNSYGKPRQQLVVVASGTSRQWSKPSAGSKGPRRGKHQYGMSCLG